MKRILYSLSVLALCAAAVQAEPLKMVINEWNCVSASKTIKNGDTFFGSNVLGNGDNWIELAVISDHLDIRGWVIQWDNTDSSSNSGSLTFSNAAIWSDLRQGTIVGLREYDSDGAYGPLTSDTHYNPFGDDWTIFADIGDTELITKNGWKVDNDDWKAKILDAKNNVIQDYVGEPATATYRTTGALGDDEAGRLSTGPRIEPTGFIYEDKKSSSFLSPNNGQEENFATMRAEVLVPEPGTAVMLLGGLFTACGILRFRRKRPGV
jgi:hypothetical protein